MIPGNQKSIRQSKFLKAAALLAVFFLFFLICMQQGRAFGQVASPPQPQATSAETGANVEEFSYKWENRPDPFMPFLTEETVKEESKAATEELTGMQKFEPGQLNLVAIVVSNGEHIAMVQDSIGKGYIIRRGTKIGRSGVVDNITDNEVIIKESFIAPFTNKLMHKNIQMVLRKDGDKKQ